MKTLFLFTYTAVAFNHSQLSGNAFRTTTCFVGLVAGPVGRLGVVKPGREGAIGGRSPGARVGKAAGGKAAGGGLIVVLVLYWGAAAVTLVMFNWYEPKTHNSLI